MRVFKTLWFRRFARKEKVADSALCDAVARAERGLIDADLGGGLIKQRVWRPGSGRSGGYRQLRATADLILALTEGEIDQAVAAGRFEELDYDGRENT
jgi:hypothetical protein